MKKKTIWALIALLSVTFVVLITLQIVYVHSLISIQAESFDDAVQRSLSRVSYLLERDESRRYLEKELNERDRELLSIRSSAYILSMTQKGQSLSDASRLSPPTLEYHSAIWQPDFFDSGLSKGNDTDNPADESILRERYLSQQNLLNDVVLQILYQASSSPVSERINYKKLEEYLHSEMQKNGLDAVSLYYQVLEKDGQVVHSGGDAAALVGSPDYVERLFPNDLGDTRAMLYLYIPSRSGVIRNPMITFIPTVLFSLILLALTIIVVWTLWRQRALSDMKNDFIRNMTHELKTPVSSILLASQMLNDKDVRRPASANEHIVSVITDESKRLNMLIEKVLQISLFEKGHQASNKMTEVDINHIISGVASSFTLKVEQSGGRLETALQVEDARVFADELNLTNVIFNLLDNAYKYRDPERPLHLLISTSRVQDSLEIRVSDNGIGIRKEDCRRIFDRFYRVSSGDVHNVKGFGLGLAYVHQVIRQHDGDIRVESEFGKGTTFIIHLPII
ncbi:MAG: HAMP domain-containing histidine kinase [Bacteroidales bacterium]|nr:HAMP domain-containing histidine kinase [Bacteroidales bacterium]